MAWFDPIIDLVYDYLDLIDYIASEEQKEDSSEQQEDTE